MKKNILLFTILYVHFMIQINVSKRFEDSFNIHPSRVLVQSKSKAF